MWIASSKGFFSAVQKTGDKHLTVRARVRKHLERLTEAYPNVFMRIPGEDQFIETGGGTDYPYRVFVTKEGWAEVMAQESRAIDYSNFKNQLEDQGDHGYHDLCSKVWSVFYDAEGKIEEIEKRHKRMGF